MTSSLGSFSPVQPSNSNQGTERPQATRASWWLCCFGSSRRVTPAQVQTDARLTATAPSPTATRLLPERHVAQASATSLQASDFEPSQGAGSRHGKGQSSATYLRPNQPQARAGQAPAHRTEFDEAGACETRSQREIATARGLSTRFNRETPSRAPAEQGLPKSMLDFYKTGPADSLNLFVARCEKNVAADNIYFLIAQEDLMKSEGQARYEKAQNMLGTFFGHVAPLEVNGGGKLKNNVITALRTITPQAAPENLVPAMENFCSDLCKQMETDYQKFKRTAETSAQ